MMMRRRRRRRRKEKEAKEEYVPRIVVFKMSYFVYSSVHVVSYNSPLKPLFPV